MAISLKVKQVDKRDHPMPHRRIQFILGAAGEFEWRHTQEQAISFIENKLFHYHVEIDSRPVPLVVGATSCGEKFLKTQFDGESPELLLGLPGRFPSGPLRPADG